MSAVATLPTTSLRPTIADLLEELGDVPAYRVLREPPPGTATEADCVRVNAHGVRCELVNGTLVEKPMGSPEEFFAALLIQYLGPFIRRHRLGNVCSSSGMFRMLAGNIREPEVGFVRRGRMPVPPAPQVFDECPDLCVEVISPGNTAGEMALKRAEYFASGCRLMWLFYVERRTVEVYSAADAPVVRLGEADILDGGEVLPGFTLSLAELFREHEIGMSQEP